MTASGRAPTSARSTAAASVISAVMSIPSADAPRVRSRSLPAAARRQKVTTELPCRAGDELTLERAHAAAQAMSTTEWSPIIRRITCGFNVNSRS